MFGSVSARRCIADLEAGADTIRRQRYGVIAVSGGELQKISFRLFPKVASLPEARLWGRWRHRWHRGDVCWLYYNQPRGSERYLALSYVLSDRDATFGTFRRAVEVLDKVARLKGSHAIVCDVSNARISDRLLSRWGWEPHLESRWHRHFIKRFGAVSGESRSATAELCGAQ